MVSPWHSENRWLPETRHALLVEIPCLLHSIPLQTALFQQIIALNLNTTSILAAGNGSGWFGAAQSIRQNDAVPLRQRSRPINRRDSQRGL